MYTKDKKYRITLRLNDNQMNFVVHNSETLQISPSDFIRMIIDMRIAEEQMYKNINLSFGGVQRRENEQTNFNY